MTRKVFWREPYRTSLDTVVAEVAGEEVRLADCFRNGYEVHLPPGAGDLDFADLFRLLEGGGFRGHYTNAFGSLDDMLTGRDVLVRLAREAGIAVD